LRDSWAKVAGVAGYSPPSFPTSSLVKALAPRVAPTRNFGARMRGGARWLTRVG